MKKENLFEMQYFETYYIANIVTNLIEGAFSRFEFLGLTSEFFDNDKGKFLEAFPKYSALHKYIGWAIDTYNYEDLTQDEMQRVLSGQQKLWVDMALKHHGFEDESFDDYLEEKNKTIKAANLDDITEYLDELRLRGVYEELLDKIGEEVFFILFINRGLLESFNSIISQYISEIRLEDIDEVFEDEDPILYSKAFKEDGVLQRCNIPKWARKAVFYRDRGKCSSCHKDLTGIINLTTNKNFDHIIPLAQGGINDVTNLQLLCEQCNKSKRHNLIPVSKHYEKWY